LNRDSNEGKSVVNTESNKDLNSEKGSNSSNKSLENLKIARMIE